MVAHRSIIQIIPAGTWKARFKPTQQHAQPGAAGPPKLPLACWALTDTGTLGAPVREIVGMIVSIETPGRLIYADEEPGFVTYEST